VTTLEVGLLSAMLGQWRLQPGHLGRRLGQRLVVLIDEGAIPDGAALPTERALAERLGISRSTATAAYRHAKDAGRLSSRQGAGSWARAPRDRRPDPGAAVEPARRPDNPAFSTLGRPVEGVVDLSLAKTRCDAATRAVLEQIDPAWLIESVQGTGYHPQGAPALRAALAGYLTTRGHQVGPDGLLVTTGAQQAIALAAMACCPPGATVLVEEASYPGALEVFRRLGLRTLPIPTDTHGPDPAALGVLLARTRPALVYLVPVGNNPTGVVVPGARLDALAETLSRSGAVLLEDRTAAPLADPATVPAPLATRMPRGTTVVVGSMSKIVWAGVRVGWLLAPPAVLRDALGARIATDLAGSAVSQALALRIVPHLPHLAAAVRADLDVGHATLRTALAADLPTWTGAEPGAGAWRWLRIPGDARTFARAAAAAGVLVTPGPAFSPHAMLSDHLRIACVAPPDVLREGVARLRQAWETVRWAGPEPGDGRDLLLI
jgi:DNA-binding transcriptional MocR family regulator